MSEMANYVNNEKRKLFPAPLLLKVGHCRMLGLAVADLIFVVNQSSFSCTTTIIRIHGWTQHSHLDTPFGNAALPAVGPDSVFPASTNWLAALSG